jgi:hypothetical protein
MSKHYPDETPLPGVAVFAVHTIAGSFRDHNNYLVHDGQDWRYSSDVGGGLMTGRVLRWYDNESEAHLG